MPEKIFSEDSDSTASGRINSTDTPPEASEVEGAALESSIADIMEQIEPVLNGLFKAGADNDDYWMKAKTVRVFSDWIISILNISRVMEQQIGAQGEVLAAQETELETLREKKSKMWVPGV
jgi:hypothetical protein